MADHLLPRYRRATIAAALAGATLLSACATPTPYQPITGRGSYAQGYADQQIEPNRFQVSFSGNSLTSRETVERYLLFRAAQLTLERGFDHFVLVERDTERRTNTYTTPNGFGPGFGGFGYWSPYWRYYGRGFGWRSPFWGDPFFDRGFDVRTVDRYQALAEIVTGRGPKPRDNVRAFDARAVIDSLGPQIQVPQGR